mgnify:FL=1
MKHFNPIQDFSISGTLGGFYQPDMINKLLCTFTTQEDLEETLHQIKTRYKVVFDKIYILKSEDCSELICTYNVDSINITGFLNNTILAHRKKESQTLYTINSLNKLIKTLNNGILDTSYKVNWEEYKNCILLTQDTELKIFKTKLDRTVKV